MSSAPLWSLQDAKNRFSAVVDAALAGTPQTVSRRGKPAVVVVSAAEYEQLLSLKRAQAPSFCDLILALPTDDGSFERQPLRPRDVDF